MKRVLKDLKPEKVFYYFEEICNIPHGSGNTKAISDYCIQFARERGLEYYQDEWNNVIIKKEASKGYENVPTIILQGHLDMVCEKIAGCEHDFLKDPLSLVVDGDKVYANGTTLGGDDGIAIAYALAILDDGSISHPPLEIVMTTEEETGMDGAQGLDCSQLSGKYMINIDSEEEGCVLVSCAGGVTVYSTLPIKYKKATGIEYTFLVDGLKGGHSGTDIDKQRANAIVLLGRFLALLEKKNLSPSVLHIEGGGKDNAIPREGSLTFLLDEENEENLRKSFHQFEHMIKMEYQVSEPSLSFSLKRGDTKKEIDGFSDDCKQKLLTFLLNAFHGVFTMSMDTPGIVESSSNLGIVQTTKEYISFCFAARSSREGLRDFLVDKYRTLTESLGGDISVRGAYPAWEYKADSHLRSLAIDKYKELTGKDLIVLSIHAGLECGIFTSKMKDLDVISIGPDILDIHTPMERLCISSVARVYEYLLTLLKDAKDYL